MKLRLNIRTQASLVGAVLLLPMLAACSTDQAGSRTIEKTQTTNAQAAAAVPENIRESGELKVRLAENSPPGSFRSKAGMITGWEVELAGLLGERMGIPVSIASVPFDQVISGVVDSSADIGIASMFDTPAREELVDFVNYFEGGTGWLTYKDSSFESGNPCGKSIGARTGTAQFNDFLPQKSQECVAAGSEPIEVVDFPDEISASDSVKLQRIDAMVADSTVVSHLADQSLGRLVVVGAVEEPQPYGIAVAKNNEELVTALRLALSSLMADGTYDRLLGKWGVESGAIDQATTNAGSR